MVKKYAMISEAKFIKMLLKNFNNIYKVWKNGDEISRNAKKSADLINKKLRVAIEVKDDNRDYEDPKLELAIKTIKNQLKSDAKSAREKFRNYSKYKTVLLIRSPLWDMLGAEIINFIFPGYRPILELGENFATLGKTRDKYFSPLNNDIGAYVFYGENKIYYLINPVADKYRVLKFKTIKKYLKDIKLLFCPKELF